MEFGVQSLPGVGRRTSDRLSATRSTNPSRDADAFLPSGHPIGSGAHRSSPLPLSAQLRACPPPSFLRRPLSRGCHFSPWTALKPPPCLRRQTHRQTPHCRRHGARGSQTTGDGPMLVGADWVIELTCSSARIGRNAPHTEEVWACCDSWFWLANRICATKEGNWSSEQFLQGDDGLAGWLPLTGKHPCFTSNRRSSSPPPFSSRGLRESTPFYPGFQIP